MACPKNLWCFDLFLLFAPSRLRVKTFSVPSIAEVSRKDAKPLRFRDETRCINSYAFFAPWRLGVTTSSLPCIVEISRKEAKPPRFEAVLLNWVNLRSFCFAPLGRFQ